MSTSNTFNKRQKELRRKEKQQEKEARKAARKRDPKSGDSDIAYLATGEAAGNMPVEGAKDEA